MMYCGSCDKEIKMESTLPAVSLEGINEVGRPFCNRICCDCGSGVLPSSPKQVYPNWGIWPHQVLSRIEAMTSRPGADPLLHEMQKAIFNTGDKDE